MEKLRKIKSWAGWFVAAVLYFGIHGYNLQFPDEMYYDEVYFVKTAREIINLNGYTDTVQPPFGKLLIALNILIFGDHSWAWRMVSLAAGFGCLAVLYQITKLLTKSSRTAFFAAFLFSLDCVSFTQARIAMLNAGMFLFMLLSILFLIKHVVTREWTRQKAFLWSGICFGFSVGSRLIGVSIGAVLALFYFSVWRESKNKRSLIEDTVIYLMIISFFCYEVSYLIIPFIKGFDWSTIWKLQFYMAKYHLTLKQGHTYGSEWWTWPLMIRPIWYFYRIFNTDAGSMVNGILCIGNPVIFWMMPVAIGYVIREHRKTKTWVSAFVLMGFFTQWLQWAFVSRVKFFHYIYTVMPFVTIAMALGLEQLWRSGKAGKGAVLTYLALVVAMFIYWLPLLNGMSISEAYFRQHMWFKSWI